MKKKKNISPAITHFPTPKISHAGLTKEKKIEIISDHFKIIMETLGLDLTNDSLAKTPCRVAKMYVDEFFSGLEEENFPSISFFDDDLHPDSKTEMVFVKVGFASLCEHHFVPMTGFAYVAYKAKEKIIGLSKIPRIVRYFASRPQVQERLNAQIADSLAILLEHENVAVSISAHHHCVRARGIQDENNRTITNVLRGEFQSNDQVRREFFEAIHRND